MASVDAQWMPVTGRHKVDIGPSLGRALKARKGIAPPKRASNLPDREFYSFRYNFKPESIDPDKPGSIEVKRTKESTSVTVERPSAQARETHLFKGTEQPVREYDCVLVYDEDMGTFTLEKIDSFMNFSYDRKVQTSSSTIRREMASPMTVTPRPADDDIDLVKELEKDLVGLEDAEGEPDDDFEEVIATVSSAQKIRAVKEEEEEEEDEFLLAASTAPPPTLPPKSKPPRSIPNQQEPMSKPKPKSKGYPKSQGGIPRPRISLIPNWRRSSILAFPLKPPPVAQLALPNASTSVVLPSSRPPPKEESDSEEDDWDPVLGGDTRVENDAQEIDLDAFEQEMEQQLEGLDEDILAAAEMSQASRRPISLNQFAGGEMSQDSDSTSSSDDSDED
ncbi:RNA polymerase II transcription elongation factor-domain-containing protein [Boletus reticuloceps]|uniref:RNA polymerase II transcription elongation factor-domain-containing protein n=1 Tax=Boletus reticuloceps TaxID=495285 RepID=A0A8I2YND8_9AGAM|nr:RNA polymerase II transcription elongation factor-domain-containing protein [Boletus reticuloceps]